MIVLFVAIPSPLEHDPEWQRFRMRLLMLALTAAAQPIVAAFAQLRVAMAAANRACQTFALTLASGSLAGRLPPSEQVRAAARSSQ